MCNLFFICIQIYASSETVYASVYTETYDELKGLSDRVLDLRLGEGTV